jgi:hypothetical protein
MIFSLQIRSQVYIVGMFSFSMYIYIPRYDGERSWAGPNPPKRYIITSTKLKII